MDLCHAPSEANAQLALMQKLGLIQHVITEGSDLIIHNVNSIIYKALRRNATWIHIRRQNFDVDVEELLLIAVLPL